MQAFIGVIIFAVIVVVALAISHEKTKGEQGFFRYAVYIPSYFTAVIVGCYVAMALFGAVLWIVAWVGILLREILQWLVVAVLYPWQWIF